MHCTGTGRGEAGNAGSRRGCTVYSEEREGETVGVRRFVSVHGHGHALESILVGA
jgi:hypothetical protein